MPTAQPSDWGFASELDDVGGAVAIAGVGEADHTQGVGPHDARRSRPRRSSARSPTPASRRRDVDGIMYTPFAGDQFTADDFRAHFGTSHELWVSTQGGGMVWAGSAPVRRGARDPRRAGDVRS